MNKSLLSINDLSKEGIEKIYTLAAQIKANPANYQRILSGKIIGLIFEKPSTRTWISFEVGIATLGGRSIYLGPEDIKLGVREEIRDVARVLNRYLEGIVIRTFEHKILTEFGKYFQKPMINGLSNHEHPCQALTDYFTIRERLPGKKNPIVAFIGDGNNVLNSLILLNSKLGGTLRYATPKKHTPDPKILEQAQKLAEKSGAKVEGFVDPEKAVQGADVVYTDVWISMGQETLREEKLKEFQGMQVNDKLMKLAQKDAIIMHCLPAHRGEEITNDVIESKNSVVFDQAENRLHIQKAILISMYSVENGGKS